MPKHDAPSGKGRCAVSTMETAMGKRLFVWDRDGNSHGLMTWAQVFKSGVLGAARV